MKGNPRWVILVALGAAVVPSAAAGEKWIHARTEHFEIFSSASEGESRELLGKLEQFRGAALNYFPLRHDHEPRATVVLFETDRRFQPYKPLSNGKPQEVAGYFIGAPDEVVIALTNEYDFDVTMEIIFHEYVHLLLRARGDNPPPWLNEGLAELFSTFTVKKDSFEMGQAKPAHVAVLNRGSLMPLEELFAVTQQSPEYHEGQRRGIFYAESWALLHYMIFGQDRAVLMPKLQRFLNLLSAPAAVTDKCFREAFGTDYDGMLRDLHQYLIRGRYYVGRRKLLLGDLSAQIKFSRAADFERDLALLNLRLRAQQPADTAYQVMQIAQRHPESPRPHEVLAAVAMQEHDVGAALHHWERAAELGSDNAFVYVQLANERLRQIMVGLTLDYRLPADSATILRGWLDRALSLSPDYLEAYDDLALVEALAEKPRIEAVNRVQAAAPKMRDPSRGLLAIAIIHWRLQDFSTSRQITEALLAAPRISPQVRRLAQKLSQRLPLAAPMPASGAVQKLDSTTSR